MNLQPFNLVELFAIIMGISICLVTWLEYRAWNKQKIEAEEDTQKLYIQTPANKLLEEAINRSPMREHSEYKVSDKKKSDRKSVRHSNHSSVEHYDNHYRCGGSTGSSGSSGGGGGSCD